MKIILLGPPGSGKGTQGDLVGKKYGFPKISTGDLLRQAVKEGTPLGKKAEVSMSQGGLVSDDIVIEMVRDRVLSSDCQKGYILDGFPRNIPQAHRLEEIDPERQEIVLDVCLSEPTLIDRLSSRRICSRCGAVFNLVIHNTKKRGICDECGAELIQRQDDRPEVIKERLRVYHENTEALVEYYKKKYVYHCINSEAKIEDVFKSICTILEKEIAKSREIETSQ